MNLTRPMSRLYVEVTETDYLMRGKLTLRNLMLARLLQRIGGVNHSVPPGMYTFSVGLNRKLQVCTNLLPVSSTSGVR